ncbi:hypothetical protein [Crocosphaera sp. Alani8]
MAAHSGLAKIKGMSQENLDALRKGVPMPDQKLEALRHWERRKNVAST